MTNPPHARVFDIPGWPCPPRVSDIPNRENGWGHIDLGGIVSNPNVVADELGFLWVRGETAPAYRLPNETHENPGAIVFNSPNGIGLYIHPKSYRWLRSVSRLDLQDKPDVVYLPVNDVVNELPPHVKEAF